MILTIRAALPRALGTRRRWAILSRPSTGGSVGPALGNRDRKCGKHRGTRCLTNAIRSQAGTPGANVRAHFHDSSTGSDIKPVHDGDANERRWAIPSWPSTGRSVGPSLCHPGRECGKHLGTTMLGKRHAPTLGACEGDVHYRSTGSDGKPVHDDTATLASGVGQSRPRSSTGRSVGLSLCHQGRECGKHGGTTMLGKRHAPAPGRM